MQWEVTAESFLEIVNESLASGVFPESWKESIIIPLEKVKGTVKCAEFRPINMLEAYEKVLEVCVQRQLVSYMEEYNILIQEQSGFRRNHSCETALNYVIIKWKEEWDLKKKVIAVFLDFKRAFETVDQDILLQKLESYGIRNKELGWFKTYLKGRKQRTRVGDSTSESVNVELGVPQGSVLGTILFLIYINDIKNVVIDSEIKLFADDTLIYVTGSDINECVRSLERDLERLNEWLAMNRLKLNVSKSKYMCVNTKYSDGLKIGDEKIECVSEIKYLGVIIDEKLNFNSHVQYLCKKVAKKIGFLSRVRNDISIWLAVRIYNAIIKPHFEYCSTILFMVSDEMKSRLQKLQNRGMRVILKCNILTPIRWMLDSLMWMSVNQRIVMNVLIFIFKMKSGLIPEYLSCRISYVVTFRTTS